MCLRLSTGTLERRRRGRHRCLMLQVAAHQYMHDRRVYNIHIRLFVLNTAQNNAHVSVTIALLFKRFVAEQLSVRYSGFDVCAFLLPLFTYICSFIFQFEQSPAFSGPPFSSPP